MIKVLMLVTEMLNFQIFKVQITTSEQQRLYWHNVGIFLVYNYSYKKACKKWNQIFLFLLFKITFDFSNNHF